MLMLPLFVFMSALAIAAPAPKAVSPTEVPALIARVGEWHITTAQYQRYGARRIPQLKEQFGPNFQITRVVRQQLLEEMVQNRLLLIQAEASDAIDKPTHPEVEAKLEELEKTLPPRITLEQFLKEEGHTPTTIRNEIRDRLLLDSYRNHLGTDVEITGEEVAALYKEWDSQGRTTRQEDTVSFSLILAKIRPEDPASIEAAQEKIAMIQERLDEGENFLELAAKHSDEPNAQESRGIYRDVGISNLSPIMQSSMDTVKDGEVSAPFKSAYGINVLKVLGRHPAKSTISLEEMSETIQQVLFLQKRNALIREKVESLQHIVDIEIYKNPIPMEQVKE